MKKAIALAVLMAASVSPALANDEHMDQKIQYWFNKMDTDNNGSITKAEHDTVGTAMFGDADTNDDDMLTIDEFKTHKMKEMDEMKASMGEKKGMGKSMSDHSATGTR